eukprot:TRINITY_DN70_c0_g1_i1.p1 TRINITY_DN70_c0_g1~~TRINITY_DN70_c0_g1_i1.p1  ORF type:complete len:142 (-),score=40.52 TRINITY_DN70_c0_g1_i1:126-551(-)
MNAKQWYQRRVHGDIEVGEDANTNGNTNGNGKENVQNSEDEIEAVVDFGGIFIWYIIQHYYELHDLWTILNEIDASGEGESNKYGILWQSDRAVRKSPFDNNLLHDLWTILIEINASDDDEKAALFKSRVAKEKQHKSIQY